MIKMAILNLPTGYFELSPQPTIGEWLPTCLALELAARDEKLLLENERRISIQKADYIRLISTIREFVNSRIINLNESDLHIKPSPRVEFSPLELHFLFTCLDGELDADLEGEITLQIMVNLETIDTKLSSTYLGGVFNIEARNLITFVNQLEGELFENL